MVVLCTVMLFSSVRCIQTGIRVGAAALNETEAVAFHHGLQACAFFGECYWCSNTVYVVDTAEDAGFACLLRQRGALCVGSTATHSSVHHQHLRQDRIPRETGQARAAYNTEGVHAVCMYVCVCRRYDSIAIDALVRTKFYSPGSVRPDQ